MISPDEFSRGLVVDSAQMYLESRYKHNLSSFAGRPDRFVKEVRTYLEASAKGGKLNQGKIWLQDLVSQFPELIEIWAYRRSLYEEMEAWAGREREQIVPGVSFKTRTTGEISPPSLPDSSRRGEEDESLRSIALPGMKTLEGQAMVASAVDTLAGTIVATTGTSISGDQIAAYRRILA